MKRNYSAQCGEGTQGLSFPPGNRRQNWTGTRPARCLGCKFKEALTPRFTQGQHLHLHEPENEDFLKCCTLASVLLSWCLTVVFTERRQ